MVPVVVLGLAVDIDRQSMVLLTPLGSSDRQRTIVPIWVGSEEAALVSIAMHGDSSARPITHDLLQNLVMASHAVLDRVEIPRVEDMVFVAELHLTIGLERIVLDCRAADAIAMALRLDAPVFLAEAVLEEEGALEELVDDAESEADEFVAEFRRFLDSAEPGDFTT